MKVELPLKDERPATVKAVPTPVRPTPPPREEGPRRPRRGNWRKALFRLHGWVGLNAGLLLFVICFSGSVATISNEIDRMLNPAMRAEARDTPYAWTEMHAALHAAFPGGTNLGVYTPVEPGFAALAYISLPTGETRKIYLNPYSGALQGHASFFNVQRFFRSFHRRFFDGYRGITIITLMGFVLLVSAVSGLLFYKGWIRQLFTLRRGRGRRLLWSDIHKTSGIWVLLFAVLIAVTGIFYFVEEQLQRSGNGAALLPPPLPEVDARTLEELGPQPDLLPAAAYVEAAKAVFPDLEIRSMRMPQSPTAPVYVDGQAGNPITRDRANKILLHPFTAEVIAVQRSSDLGVVPFVTDAVDPLHFGYFGGLPTKLLWLGLGLLLSFSVLSGTYLWVVRLSTARQRHTSFWLRGATVSIAVTLGYFILVVFTTIDGIRFYAPQHPNPVHIREMAAGPYDLSVNCDLPCVPPEGARYRLRLDGLGLPNYASVTLAGPAGAATVTSAPSRSPSATLHSDYGAEVRVRFESWSGTVYESSFQAPNTPVRQDAALSIVPDTAPGVWWVIAAFVASTLFFIALWFFFIIRAFLRQSTSNPHG
jgi:uncharacterized iron-regulated membrane protein